MSPLAASPLGAEALDSPTCDPEVARATLHDIGRVNTLFGGRQAAAWGLDRLLDRHPRATAVTLLDVGAGGGDILAYLVRVAARRGMTVRPVSLDRHRTAAALCRDAGLPGVVADAADLPVGAVDIVLLSQILHHLSRAAAADLVRAAAHVARLGIIVADARRSVAALAGIWLVTLAPGFHPATRHDGMLSVRRSFTRAELAGVFAAAGVRGRVYRRPGFRLVGIADAHG